MKIKEFLEKNRVLFQMIYGVFLIILIPTFIAFNTIYLINKYSESIDTTIQRNGLLVGRSIYALIKSDLNNNDILQNKIELLASKSTDILEINVLKPGNDNFIFVASSNPENINKFYKYEYYDLAWAQPDNDGLATDFVRVQNEDDLVINPDTGNRFWLIAMPMSDFNGHKEALLTVKLSSDIVDRLVSENRTTSIYVLILTILFVILFLAIAVRLWDYALLYKKIKEVDQMKDEFISMASHELRTPVTAIRGYASLILEGSFGEVNEEVKKSLSNINSSAKRLNLLVEDLLEVSRIEQGRIEVKSSPTDVNPIIAKTVEDLTVQAKEKNLVLSYLPHSDKLPLINIDQDKFTQIIVNLIGNAIKYTKEGTVEVFTEVKDSGKILEIKVKDSGVGMSANERKNLFGKFYRIQNESTKGIGGTGLGLWITKKMVDLMGGQITVDSIEKVGTQFTVSFPIIKG
ncbi:hypothetical protein COW81_01420 [Candidatus Campbellbacteria bacterium CG22_combo_CG10-13_8_21_14_all_36_13]|uniref:histidine kinase n=1 Tax=Candidatus Campbellbacteria bacterium CG22_combo_CG10-13_8_21_14_all_36_13 TaxID=1974529 RepID=A0A2H0DYF1_9BACT|nr:MAG: hypothetical protein COW81_01420 [Candidatus Campbellbacteria bacterium CG22_combo_CG10-13_8_21_14_all_36_13]